MFFTQEDYRKIEKWLLANSVKDTEFAGASLPLKGNETVAFVQDGKNVNVFLKDLIEQIFLLGVSDFLNVTDKYGESRISLTQAIQLIPYKSRKIGQVITFLDEDGEWKLFQFQGERVNQWNNATLWVDLIKRIQGIISIIDSEDITATVDNLNQTSLTFADKNYNTADYSGLGRVYLRKNIQTVVNPNTGITYSTNFLTQAMLSKENTIYIIQYDYNLNGKTITIPSGCVLLFEGGSISNGSIILLDTPIIGITDLSNVNLYGSINNVTLSTSLYGFIPGGVFNNYYKFKALVNAANSLDRDIEFVQGTYLIRKLESEELTIKSSIDFKNSSIILDTGEYENFRINVIGESINTLTDSQLEEIQSVIDIPTKGVSITDKELFNSLILLNSDAVELRRYLGTSYLPISKFEMFYIDEHGYLEGSQYNYSFKATRGVFIKNAGFKRYIRNADIKLISSYNQEQVSEYRNIGFHMYNTFNSDISGITIDTTNIDSGDIKYTINSPILISESYNALISNVQSSNTKDDRTSSGGGQSSSYIIGLNKILNVQLKDVNVSGLDSKSWGSMGCNYVYNLYAEKLSISRFDVHYRLHNATLNFCQIGKEGITYTGSGVMSLNSCTFMKKVLSPRSDYQSTFYGDIYMNDCTIKVIDEESASIIDTTILYYPQFGNTQPGYIPFICRNLYVDNLTIDFGKYWNKPYSGAVSLIRIRDGASGDYPVNYRYTIPNVYIKGLNCIKKPSYYRVFVRDVDSNVWYSAYHSETNTFDFNHNIYIEKADLTPYTLPQSILDRINLQSKPITANSCKSNITFKDMNAVAIGSQLKYTTYTVINSIITSSDLYDSTAGNYLNRAIVQDSLIRYVYDNITPIETFSFLNGSKSSFTNCTFDTVNTQGRVVNEDRIYTQLNTLYHISDLNNQLIFFSNYYDKLEDADIEIIKCKVTKDLWSIISSKYKGEYYLGQTHPSSVEESKGFYNTSYGINYFKTMGGDFINPDGTLFSKVVIV